MARQSQNMLDQVVEDLALWIDTISGQLAEGMSAGGTAPFAAQLTEAEKLNYYTNMLFQPDGTPNMKGRAQEMQRLGPEGFASVYKAVVKAHPSLAIPAPPAGAVIQPSSFIGAPPVGPPVPGLPAGLGMPRQSGGQQVGEAALASVSPGGGQGPLG